MTSVLELSEKRRLLLERMLAREGLAAAEPRRIPRREGGGPAPLSFGQQRLWFLSELDPESPAYSITETVRLRGTLDAEAAPGPSSFSSSAATARTRSPRSSGNERATR